MLAVLSISSMVSINLANACSITIKKTAIHPKPLQQQEHYLSTSTPYDDVILGRVIKDEDISLQGFKPVLIEVLSRHGARSLTSLKHLNRVDAVVRYASAHGLLTPLGREYSTALSNYRKVNEHVVGLGHVSTSGRQSLERAGMRLKARFPKLLHHVGPQDIEIQTSGITRAQESAVAFARGLLPANQMPPDSSVNRFSLYFHKLNDNTDRYNAMTKQQEDTLTDSLNYQAFLKSSFLQKKIQAVENEPNIRKASRAILLQLFAPSFVDQLEAGMRFEHGPKQDKKLITAQAVAQAIYKMYALEPALEEDIQQAGLQVDFSRFVPASDAMVFAQESDALQLMRKGASYDGLDGITVRMAQGLVEQMFATGQQRTPAPTPINALNEGLREPHKVILLFSHAEVLIPFATLLQLNGVSQPLSEQETFSWKNNPWRGDKYFPMGVNIQWEFYENAKHQKLIRMLWNENPTHFAKFCSSAQLKPSSYFYHYGQLRTCYQRYFEQRFGSDPHISLKHSVTF